MMKKSLHDIREDYAKRASDHDHFSNSDQRAEANILTAFKDEQASMSTPSLVVDDLSGLLDSSLRKALSVLSSPAQAQPITSSSVMVPPQDMVLFRSLFVSQAGRVVPPELSEFLRLVAEGEEDKVEAMLQKNRDLVLFSGNVTDLSKRTFKGITAFQYAVWALDLHMWMLLLRYLSREEALTQAQQFETGPWIQSQGVHAGPHLQRLITALKTYVDNYFKPWTVEEGKIYWISQVGVAQLLLPVHVWNEYCHPKRSFDPCPNFEDTSNLPRTRKVYTTDSWQEDILTATWNNKGLGSGFALYRGGSMNMRCGADVGVVGVETGAGMGLRDYRAITALLSTRIQQRDKLITELSNNSRPESAHRVAIV